MPKVLTDSDVADFRERLCVAAERLFAEQGLEAVTMRQLAAELGVSPMTPYRYFDDKDEILASIRAAAFEKFTDALEGAGARGEPLSEAYITFGLENPRMFKLLFDLNQPDVSHYPALVSAIERARGLFDLWLMDITIDGPVEGDPRQIGSMFWAAAHGVTVLELAGKLPPGAALELHRATAAALRKGLRS